jgi:hypothetical protein
VIGNDFPDLFVLADVFHESVEVVGVELGRFVATRKSDVDDNDEDEEEDNSPNTNLLERLLPSKLPEVLQGADTDQESSQSSTKVSSMTCLKFKIPSKRYFLMILLSSSDILVLEILPCSNWRKSVLILPKRQGICQRQCRGEARKYDKFVFPSHSSSTKRRNRIFKLCYFSVQSGAFKI